MTIADLRDIDLDALCELKLDIDRQIANYTGAHGTEYYNLLIYSSALERIIDGLQIIDVVDEEEDWYGDVDYSQSDLIANSENVVFVDFKSRNNNGSKR